MSNRKEGRHLLFFDENCPLCLRAVKRVLQLDRARQFLFAPLAGRSAEEKLRGLRETNTLILLENIGAPDQKIWIRGRGALRIFWLLGGWRKVLGVFCFLPFGPDLIYRLIAHHRHQLLSNSTPFTHEEKTRFLP